MKRNGIFENQWKTNQNIIIMYLKEQEKNCGKNVMSLNEWNNIILTMRQTKTLIIGIKLNLQKK